MADETGNFRIIIIDFCGEQSASGEIGLMGNNLVLAINSKFNGTDLRIIP